MTDDALAEANITTVLHPLEALAWSGLSEDEFVERLAQEVWRRPHRKIEWARPALPIYGTHVGVSSSKVRAFVNKFGASWEPKRRRVMVEKVTIRARWFMDQAVRRWAAEIGAVIEDTFSYPYQVPEVRETISLRVPKGARALVEERIRARLGMAPLRKR